ncbi:MAG: MFS transporter [Thaumarchaeota archaeon]|nr:MAG: MFS transporter [Nitrososphaerota archaeon]
MSCCNNGKITRKKMIIFSLVAGAIGVSSYFLIFTTNIAAAASLPVLTGFVACPLMCAAMGGGIWLSRLSRNKHKPDLQANSDTCCQHDDIHDRLYYENKDTQRDGKVSGLGPARDELKTNNDYTPNLNPP